MARRRGAALVGALVLSGLVLGSPAAVAADGVPGWGVEQSRPLPGTEPDADAPVGEAAARESGAAPRAAAASSTWTLSGAGWGHGVGLSQYGAMEMARDGYDAAQILGHYYTGTDYTSVDDDVRVWVNLRHGVSSSTMTTTSTGAGGGDFQVRIPDGERIYGTSGATLTFTPSGSGVTVSCATCTPARTLSSATLQVVYDDDATLLSVDGTRYRDGYVAVSRGSGSGLEVVARLDLHDEYLDYIREVPWSWPSAALQAQAAAARGYALTAVAAGRKSACDCHVYDTTASQVYGGYPSTSELSAWQSWRSAVRATGSGSTGYVATYRGSIIQSFYSSSSGGRTQNSEDGFATYVPYLRSVDDPWSLRSSNPRRSWSFTPSRSALAGVFGLSDVARLDLGSRYESGAVRTARATSAAGATATVGGSTLQSRLGLYSTYVQRPTTRYGGANRYAAAASVAASHLPSARTVVIASGEDAGRADAAVSGPLAQALDAPVLLTRNGALPPATRAELDRRRGSLTAAVIVGGPATVSADVSDDLRARGLRVTRVSGADRYEVSAAAARRVDAEHGVSAVVVASGTALADALGAGGPAGAEGEPILLTRRDAVPAPVSRALDDLGVTAVRIAGGPTSVDPSVEDALDARSGTSVRRLAGPDRYAVAAEVATFYRSRLASAERVSLASGTDAALTDALTAGSLPQMTLLVRSTGLPAATAEALQRSGDLEGLDVVGGPVSLPEAVVTAAARS